MIHFTVRKLTAACEENKCWTHKSAFFSEPAVQSCAAAVVNIFHKTHFNLIWSNVLMSLLVTEMQSACHKEPCGCNLSFEHFTGDKTKETRPFSLGQHDQETRLQQALNKFLIMTEINMHTMERADRCGRKLTLLVFLKKRENHCCCLLSESALSVEATLMKFVSNRETVGSGWKAVAWLWIQNECVDLKIPLKSPKPSKVLRALSRKSLPSIPNCEALTDMEVKNASLRSGVHRLYAADLHWEERERQRLWAIKAHFMPVCWRH